MDYLSDIFELYTIYVVAFFKFLWDPRDRLFIVYLGAAAAFALVLFLLKKHKITGPQHADEHESFLKFLFPKHVWSHPSAWLDVRYFFFHHLIGHFLMFGLMTACTAWAFAFVTGGSNLAELARTNDAELAGSDFVVAIAYMFAFYIIGDFIAYTAHYMQHKIPILWEFHKVHHSAEVMHPMSNAREHPVDDLLYKTMLGIGYGAFIGLAVNFLGYRPSMPSVFGVPVLMFLFNLMGYNLRHSHIWLRWPGVWSKVFPSPAHHHVHHSCHPEHCDKNFAFMFPVWDVIFGTYIMPEDNKDVKFGVAGMKSGEMDTCMKLYFLPFKKAFRRVTGKPAKPAEQPKESILPPAE